jgi:hypothetical protein
MLSVIYAECRYAECRYAKCRYADCRYAECHYADCHYADCRYADCHYADCRYADCRGAPRATHDIGSGQGNKHTNLQYLVITTCGLYYKLITIVNDASRVICK